MRTDELNVITRPLHFSLLSLTRIREQSRPFKLGD